MRLAANLLAVAVLGAAVGMFGSAASAQADAVNGKGLYTTNCVACHGENGDGKGPVGVALVPPPRDFSGGDFKFDTDKDGSTGSEVDLENVIKNGAAPYGGSPLMAPWAHLSQQDIQDLIAYVRTLVK